MKTSFFLWVRLMGIAVMLLLQLACTPQGLDAVSSGNSTKPASATDEAIRMPKTYALSIVGYNYTDRYIDSFFVDGRGGGNLDISTATSGGGGGVCCYTFTDTSRLPMKVRVAWVGSYCRSIRTNSDGETSTYLEPLWRIAETSLTGPIPSKPSNLEVHIYRDGHVEVAVSDRYSLPRLALPAPPNGYIRPGVTIQDPECPADYDRARSRDRAIREFEARGKT